MYDLYQVILIVVAGDVLSEVVFFGKLDCGSRHHGCYGLRFVSYTHNQVNSNSYSINSVFLLSSSHGVLSRICVSESVHNRLTRILLRSVGYLDVSHYTLIPYSAIHVLM